MKYYIIAGEPSGDAHGAKLITAIKQIDDQAIFRFWGGEKMAEQFDGLAMDIRHTSFMGFIEVMKHIRQVLKLFAFAKKDILSYHPDVVILIDYPGFNLRMAKWLKERGFKVIYYICPQVWAWKEGRAKQLRKYCDEVISILPFEQKFLLEKGVNASYVGHPLMEEIEAIKHQEAISKKVNSIAILPGSRIQEVTRMLVPMIKGALLYNPDQIFVSRVRHIDKSIYTKASENTGNAGCKIDISDKPLHNILSESKYALVTSGTASLETGLVGVPQVVCYKMNPISHFVARILVNIQFISLVNLVLNRKAVPELIQKECNPERILQSLQWLEENREDVLTSYEKLRIILGHTSASKGAASIIVDAISSSR